MVTWFSTASLLVPVTFLVWVPTARADIYLSRGSSSSVSDYTTSGTLVGSRSTGGNLNALSLDAAGNLYVTDLNGPLKFPAGQSIATAAYSSLSTSGTVGDYYGSAVDSNGNFYMTTDADSGTSSDIKVYEYTGGTGTPSLFSDTLANTSMSVFNTVAVDPISGNVFVADNHNSDILEYGISGGTTPIHTFTNGVSSPKDIAVDRLGDLYVSDGNGNLEKINISTGTPTAVETGLTGLTGIAVDGQNNLYYIAMDGSSHGGIFEVSPTGSPLGELFNTGSAEADFISVVPEPALGAIFVIGASSLLFRRCRKIRN
jgi:hypothetical protein